MQQLAEAKALLQELRSSGRESHWRLAWADSVLASASEFAAAGRGQECEALLSTFHRWYQERRLTPAMPRSYVGVPSPWKPEWILAECGRLAAELARKAVFIPPNERVSIQKRIEDARALAASDPTAARRSLSLARQSVLARVQRAWRARAHLVAVQHLEGDSSERAPRSMRHHVGPYNARFLLEDTLDMVAERDPIWVEDMLTLYNDLQGMLQRLLPPEPVAARKR